MSNTNDLGQEKKPRTNRELYVVFPTLLCDGIFIVDASNDNRVDHSQSSSESGEFQYSFSWGIALHISTTKRAILTIHQMRASWKRLIQSILFSFGHIRRLV